jgi:hypothetical protein
VRAETVSLEIPIYYTPEGIRTCAEDFGTGRVCVFYGTKSFGTKELCFAPRREDRLYRSSEKGFLVPSEHCPLRAAPSEHCPLRAAPSEHCPLRAEE